MVGCFVVGVAEGALDGELVGIFDGDAVGVPVGFCDALLDGLDEGDILSEGAEEGLGDTVDHFSSHSSRRAVVQSSS